MEAGRRPVRLRCAVQTYEWGRTGESSAVARLFARNTGGGVKTELEPARPYAEFWIGTHPSGPSFLLPEDGSKPLPLKSYILDNPGVLGDQVLDKWGTDIPFLFKVLSVAKALSIQAHPDKELAERLHRAQPSVYKDANHKPEMAIALTEFRALCGFVGFEELKDVLLTVPEITELVGNEEATKVMNIKEQCDHEEVKDSLQSIFTKLMSANKETVSELLSKLKSRLVAENQVRILTEKEKLALLLEKQYPSDIGVISSFFFNYVKLSPGEAVYIGANEPHAYLSGECIECMATSDNVVRAGLTPKFRDVKTLCSMLTYRQGFPEIMQGISLNHYITRYIPPFDEFEVDHISLPSGKSVSLPAVPGPSIFVVVAGKGNVQMDSDIWEDMVEGHAYFVPAHCEFKFRAGAAGELELYRAAVNSRFCG